ncbi:MAG: LysM peptidoglycan-binding domain-containing protein [Bacteroidota bacterium]|nr:LysM peptidoglycan-binding domain-containing protein [Bacteroidota bacterium]
MKKLFAVLLVSVAIVHVAAGQLLIKKSGKGLYLDHTVMAKEGLFSIGRIYNVHPRFIASYNNIDFDKGLNIGQVLHIPLTDTNFSQKKKGKIPVYYQAGAKENLQKVSNINNKVLIKNLRDWNKFYKDTVPAGTKLIVGYLVADEKTIAVVLKNSEKKEGPIKETPDKQPVVDTNSLKSRSVTKNETKKDDPKKIKDNKSITKNEQANNKPSLKTEPAPEKHVVKNESKKDESGKKDTVATRQVVTPNMSGQGYFKSFFDQQVKAFPVSKTETVTSGIFKMVSNQQDAKYYLLVDDVPSGTIVRIINPENNKTVYAKVLGEMSNTRSARGLNIRISNTAALALGISDTDKFIVTVNY